MSKVNYRRDFDEETGGFFLEIPKEDLKKIEKIKNTEEDTLGHKKYGSVSHYIHVAILEKMRRENGRNKTENCRRVAEQRK
jgi:hypothetical protein